MLEMLIFPHPKKQCFSYLMFCAHTLVLWAAVTLALINSKVATVICMCGEVRLKK